MADAKVEVRNLQKIEALSQRLSDAAGKVELDAVGDAVGKIEGALAKVLEQFDAKLLRFLDLSREVEEDLERIDELERGLRATQGAAGGLDAGITYAALAKNPLVRAALIGGGLVAGGVLGFGEVDRVKKAEAIAIETDNELFRQNERNELFLAESRRRDAALAAAKRLR